MSEAANADRGEHELTLAGTTYRLRPSYSAVTTAEKATGKTLLHLVGLGNSAQLSLRDLGVIGAEFIRAGAAEDSMDKHVDAERIAELIYEKGVASTTAALTLALLDAASGGRTASGEAKAVVETGGSPTAG